MLPSAHYTSRTSLSGGLARESGQGWACSSVRLLISDTFLKEFLKDNLHDQQQAQNFE